MKRSPTPNRGVREQSGVGELADGCRGGQRLVPLRRHHRRPLVPSAARHFFLEGWSWGGGRLWGRNCGGYGLDLGFLGALRLVIQQQREQEEEEASKARWENGCRRSCIYTPWSDPLNSRVFGNPRPLLPLPAWAVTVFHAPTSLNHGVGCYRFLRAHNLRLF